MIKNYLTILALLLSFSMYAQEAPQTQNSLIIATASTNSTAGLTWGTDLFNGLIEDNIFNSTIIAAHGAGLGNSTSLAIRENFDYGNVQSPHFYVNNTDQWVTEDNWLDKRGSIFLDVEAHSTTEPIANTGLTVEVTIDNKLVINTKTEFFQDVNNSPNYEWRVAAYIIENNVMFDAPTMGLVENKAVLRASAYPFAFGQLISNDDISSGTTFNHTFEIPIANEWVLDNLEVAVVIWKERPTFDLWTSINTNKTNQFSNQAVNVTNISSANLTMQIQPTVAFNHVNLILDVVKDQQDIEVIVVNQLGQVQSNVLSGMVNKGKQTIEIGNGLSNGLYFVVARIDGQVLTKHFILN